MNTPIAVVWRAPEVPDLEKKKRVLLVDLSARSRELRAEVMRRLGMDVDCAADLAEARSWWKAGLYDLVLIDMDNGLRHRDRFCEDMRRAAPPQRLAFLVGEPHYLADLPNDDAKVEVPGTLDPTTPGSVKLALSVAIGTPTRHWGILEASRRISAVRLACNARSRAMRERPAPPRDPDGRTKPIPSPNALDDLLREEMQ